jgi:pilus assembly protein Flp/PilA
MTKLLQFVKNESGATAIEYGLIAAGISIAIVVVVFSVGSSLNATFTTVDTKLSGAAT